MAGSLSAGGDTHAWIYEFSDRSHLWVGFDQNRSVARIEAIVPGIIPREVQGKELPMILATSFKHNLPALREAHFSSALSEKGTLTPNTISQYVCLKQVFNSALRAHHHFFMHTIGKTAPISLLETICAVSGR
jgi:hypothetical protein